MVYKTYINKQVLNIVLCSIQIFCFIFLFSVGVYTTLFVFFHLINLKKLNKAKIENSNFEQIQSNFPMPVCK